MRLIALQKVADPPDVMHEPGQDFEVGNEVHARLLTAGVNPKAKPAPAPADIETKSVLGEGEEQQNSRGKRQYRRRDLVSED
jgi:hypothetical protein